MVDFAVANLWLSDDVVVVVVVQVLAVAVAMIVVMINVKIVTPLRQDVKFMLSIVFAREEGLGAVE